MENKVLPRLISPTRLRATLLSILFLVTAVVPPLFSQSDDCPRVSNKRADKEFDKAVRAYRQYNYSASIRSLNEVVDIEPEYTDAWFLLGLIYIDDARMNLKAAAASFERVIELCPSYDVYP